jgi:hypothetical protein
MNIEPATHGVTEHIYGGTMNFLFETDRKAKQNTGAASRQTCLPVSGHLVWLRSFGPVKDRFRPLYRLLRTPKLRNDGSRLHDEVPGIWSSFSCPCMIEVAVPMHVVSSFLRAFLSVRRILNMICARFNSFGLGRGHRNRLLEVYCPFGLGSIERPDAFFIIFI